VAILDLIERLPYCEPLSCFVIDFKILHVFSDFEDKKQEENYGDKQDENESFSFLHQLLLIKKKASENP
jgi:hypothetical protein